MIIFKQIAIIIGFCLVGEIISWGITKLIPEFFFPGSLIGMLLLFLALYFKIFKIDRVAVVGTFFIENMGFFFVPAAVSIMSYFDVIATDIWKMLLLCMISFFLTFTSIAISVKITLLIQEKFNVVGTKKHE